MSTKYEGLEKLDELRQKGIITQEEFDKEKKQILDGSSSPREPIGGTTSTTEIPTNGLPRLKKTTVIGMILLSIVTGGIYVPAWFLNRKNSLNALRSTYKVGSALPVIALVALIFGVIFLLIGASLSSADPSQNTFYSLYYILILIEWIFIEVASFKVRRILNEHFNYKISGAGTFFFTVLCLQYCINKLQALPPNSNT